MWHYVSLDFPADLCRIAQTSCVENDLIVHKESWTIYAGCAENLQAAQNGMLLLSSLSQLWHVSSSRVSLHKHSPDALSCNSHVPVALTLTALVLTPPRKGLKRGCIVNTATTDIQLSWSSMRVTRPIIKRPCVCVSRMRGGERHVSYERHERSEKTQEGRETHTA